jgi:hypothetical protein
VRCTVPVYPVATLLLASRAVTVTWKLINDWAVVEAVTLKCVAGPIRMPQMLLVSSALDPTTVLHAVPAPALVAELALNVGRAVVLAADAVELT